MIKAAKFKEVIYLMNDCSQSKILTYTMREPVEPSGAPVTPSSEKVFTTNTSSAFFVTDFRGTARPITVTIYTPRKPAMHLIRNTT